MRDVRVLDLTLNLPGPYATHVLASLGAEVVKLEPPKGDPARHMGALFERVNRGKRSVVLDLRDPESRPHLERMIRWADVLVEGFRPGVTERLGAGPEHCHALNPRLVYCRISAYGQSGPLRDAPGHDLNLQALTGFCHLERGPAQPRATTLPVADLATSMAAVIAIGTALQGPRDRAVLDVAMSDALLSWVWTWDSVDPRIQLDRATRGWGPLRRLLGPLRARLGRERLYAMPQYGLYPTRDGWIAIGIVDERHFWKAFAEALGMRRSAGLDPGMLTLLGPVIEVRIRRRLARRTTAEWLGILDRAGVPASPVLGIDDATGHPQLSRALDGNSVRVPIPGARVPEAPAPALGADTESFLGSLT